jgi:hypothetical protein
VFVVAGLLVSAFGTGGPAARAATIADPSARQVDGATTEEPAPATGALDDRRARAAHYQQIREELYTLVEQENPRAALDRMRALMKEDPELLRSCHPFMHQIGRRAYARYGSFAEAAQYRDDICNSGYLHGAIEAHFLTVSDPVAAMRTICEGYEPNRYPSWQCYHGVGHGVMFFKKNDLPAALALCGEYASSFARGTCANGAYMENFNTHEQMHPTRYVNPDDPFFPLRPGGPGLPGRLLPLRPDLLPDAPRAGLRGRPEALHHGSQTHAGEGMEIAWESV